jgi:peroxiredoxin
MREQVSALAGSPETRWIGIASGLWATPEDLRRYRTAHGVEIPLTLDESGTLFRSFDVMQVPAALIVDAEGRIARRIEGGDIETPDALRLAIERAP